MSDSSGTPPSDPNREQPPDESSTSSASEPPEPPRPPQYGEQPPPRAPDQPPPYPQQPHPQQPHPQQPYPQQPPEQYGQQPYPQQQYGAQPPYAQQRGPNGLTPEESTWGGAAHWSALVAAFVALAFLGPLLVMLVKGNDSRYIRAQAVEALNFQLTVLIFAVVSFALVFVLIGFLLLPIVGIWWLVFTIIGSVKASQGELYRYPLTIRMVS